MTRRPSTLDQFLAIGGSDNQSDTMDQTLEPFELGQVIAGQTGSVASVTAVVSSNVTMIGLTGITTDSVGRFITIFGADSAGNNGTFLIKSTFGATIITYENAAGVAGDTNNGSIMWIERDPYTLEDDINHSRTDRRSIKGTSNWYNNVPTYVQPDDTLVDRNVNLFNIANKTLDAHAWLENRFAESLSVTTNDTFITLSIPGELQHATSTDITGVPVFDGYDASDFIKTFVYIVDANLDGYNDGENIFVQSGAQAGELIFGVTREGSSISPNAIEIAFFSRPITNWSMTLATSYVWEPSQINTINIVYSYRQRLDFFNEDTIKSAYITGVSSSSQNGNRTNLPTPSQECQILFALTSTEFTPQLPLTSDGGWLVNDDGCLLIVG